MLLVAVGWFYWFQWRPSSIRQKCAQESAEWFGEAIKTRNVGVISDMGNKLNTVREDLYTNCLHKNGLKQ